MSRAGPTGDTFMMQTPKRKDKFPLWLHPIGQWCKKHKGVFHYFGNDKDAALKRYRAEWDAILEGRPARPKAGELTVAELTDLFLADKQNKVRSGELSARTWADYYKTCDTVVAEFGKQFPVVRLSPADFAKLRAGVANRVGPVSVLNFVTRARVLFKFASDMDYIPAPAKYGKGFDRPNPKTLRKDRHQQPSKMIPAAELCKMIDAADPQLKAMILLALNGGMGSTDCAQLPQAALDIRPGWLDYPRPKTAVGRRFPLWEETTAALCEVHPIRPAAKDRADDELVFLTRLGKPWVRFNGDDKGKRSVIDSVAQMFAKLAVKCGVELPSGFYSLRSIHRTISDEVRDRPAADMIMGHADPTMGGRYRQHVSDDRLEVVVNHIRDWLFAGRNKTRKATS